MRFRVLGPLEVEVDGDLVALPGERPRALLTALLLQPNAAVSTERLVDALWGDEPPEGAHNALQQVVARLRSRSPALAESLRTGFGGYLLVVADGALDSDLFEARCRDSRALHHSDPARAADLLDRALALWRGPAYGEFADRFAQPASVRLTELRAAALEDRVALHLTLGQHAEATAAARALVAGDPLRERPVELLMRSLHAVGRTPEALEVFRNHRDRLAEELGLDPSSELRDLESRILQNDVGSVAPVAPAPSHVLSLPVRPGGLLGRERELALVVDCVNRLPVVTIVGPGGVGKTRLALEAAYAVAESRAVWWVDVTSVRPHRLLDLVAEVCGAETPRGRDPAAALGASLRARPGLLVLDNAETVLDVLAPLVERWVADAPGLTVLSTSRERLAVADEHVHLLMPFSSPSGDEADHPAVQLFLSRAHGLQEQPQPELLEAVAELCRRLDGLPLAIELGAARAPAFGIRAFTHHLDAGIDLLTGGRRAGAARHRTLRAVLDASYALLEPEEASLLARLSVFPSTFDLDQARAVCADEDMVPRAVGPALARLVEQSMVQAADGRFWLLQTLRAYAAEHVEPRHVLRLRAGHARHTAGRLEGLRWQQAPTTEPEVVATIAAMGPDLHQAWEHAVAHDIDLAVELAASIYDFAYARQRRDLLEWGLVVARWDVQHPRLPRALATAATAAWADGDLAAAEALALRGLAVGGDDPVTARSMVQAANLAMFNGRHDEAFDRFGRAGSLYAAAGEAIQSIMTKLSQCQVLAYSGRQEEALQVLPGLLAEVRVLGNPTAISWAHYVTGEALAETDPGAATTAFRQSYDEGRRADNRLFMGLARSAEVALALRTSAPLEALDGFERVIEDWADLRNEASLWGVLMMLAVLLARVGQHEEAAILESAVTSARERQPLFAAREAILQECRDRVAEAFDPVGLARLSRQGAGLSVDAAVAEARQAIDAARGRLGVRPGTPH